MNNFKEGMESKYQEILEMVDDNLIPLDAELKKALIEFIDELEEFNKIKMRE